MKTLCRYLVSINKELVNKTAIKNCHCIGLNSFIINEHPKIRLFIAEPNCELFQPFNHANPIIPIHPHKYDDTFIYLEGVVTHHIYFKSKKGATEPRDMFVFGKYKYPRISDKIEIEKVGEQCLSCDYDSDNLTELKSSTLHTVSLKGDNRMETKRCSWMIIETFEDKNFKQISYHNDLKNNKELYIHMENGYDYINNYFKSK